MTLTLQISFDSQLMEDKYKAVLPILRAFSLATIVTEMFIKLLHFLFVHCGLRLPNSPAWVQSLQNYRNPHLPSWLYPLQWVCFTASLFLYVRARSHPGLSAYPHRQKFCAPSDVRFTASRPPISFIVWSPWDGGVQVSHCKLVPVHACSLVV